MTKKISKTRILLMLAAIISQMENSAQTITKPLQTITQPVSQVSLTIDRPLLIRSNPATVFSTSFANTATGRNDVNAYLLCYLSTLIYPQYLGMVAGNTTDNYINRLHTNPDDFEKEYITYTKGLFSTPEIKFFHKSDRLGYDPEVMVISTPSTVFLVFRGTDRVGSNQSGFMYDWAEWITTDFDVRQVTDPSLPGKVLSGMWSSLKYEGFKDEVYNYIISKNVKSKKLWITGHSLGAGQAQLYAMYLARKGVVAQGVYLYAAPHPGDRNFVTEIDKTFPNQRLQRFDFITDPITTLAPYILGYERAGTRIYYNDINSISYNAQERSEAEMTSIIPGVVNAVRNTIADFINESSGKRLQLDNLLGNSTMCYHHPLWYLKAAYQQLNTDQRKTMPRPLDLPDAGTEGCDRLTVERGKSSNPGVIVNNIVRGALDDAATAINNTVQAIQFNANSIISNVTGSAITSGDYYIQSYASGNLLGMNEQDGINNGSDLRLTTGKSKVKIERMGTAGYIIEFGSKTVTTSFFGVTSSETKKYVLDSESESLYQDGSSEIQLWEKNNLPAFNANQRWLFIQVPNNPGKYVIKNLANGKVLDANNSCVNDNSCRVKTYKCISDDRTQVWTLVKAN